MAEAAKRLGVSTHRTLRLGRRPVVVLVQNGRAAGRDEAMLGDQGILMPYLDPVVHSGHIDVLAGQSVWHRVAGRPDPHRGELVDLAGHAARHGRHDVVPAGRLADIRQPLFQDNPSGSRVREIRDAAEYEVEQA